MTYFDMGLLTENRGCGIEIIQYLVLLVICFSDRIEEIRLLLA
jgi:hypothetical protein